MISSQNLLCTLREFLEVKEQGHMFKVIISSHG